MRRRSLRPPDLTSLFDVLFILVFVSLVNAGMNQQKVDEAEAAKPRPTPPAPPVPLPPPSVIALHDEALAELGARPVLIARVSIDGVLTAVEADGKRVAMDVPLIEHVADPDVAIAYLGDRSAELRVCRQAALHLGVPDLSPYLVIVTPEAALADLTVALVSGLRRDADRCLAEQHGVAVVVDPAGLVPGATP
jgi:hypothetical protein